MASLSHSALPRPTASPARAFLLGAALLVAIPLGLQMMTAQETSFYRTHGMVTDARTAVRLAQMVLVSDHRGCALPDDAAARLQGEIWTVEAPAPAGNGSCRVEIDRKDGQILRVDVRR